MVKLSFTAYVPAPLPQVWAFFSKFENVAQWDPSIPAIKIKKQNPNKIGTLYEVKTVFRGNQQTLQYQMTEFQELKRFQVEGSNFMTQSVDQMIFEQKTPGTNVTYIADIRLRHVFKLFTPFIKGDLQQIAKKAEAGFRKRSRELFGDA